MAAIRSRPPPLPRRKARLARRRSSLPTPMHLRAELLPDHLVDLDEPDEFLDEDFVIEDGIEAASGPEVVFAGPSDAPPPTPATRPHVRRAKEGGRWRM